MKKIRKGTQLKLTNQKNAGRPAIRDEGLGWQPSEENSPSFGYQGKFL
jgi:hypothetical protein